MAEQATKDKKTAEVHTAEPAVVPKPVKKSVYPVPPPAESSGNQPVSGDFGGGSFSWSAAEFLSHDKSFNWYFLLVVGAILLAGVVYLINRDFVSVSVVIVAAIVFGIFGSHKPRELTYKIDSRSITVGAKAYRFNEFRSFFIQPEGALSSVTFMPLKRFSPPLTIYYHPKDEEMILNLLAQQLPYDANRRDTVDSLMRKIRF